MGRKVGLEACDEEGTAGGGKVFGTPTGSEKMDDWNMS